MRLFFAINFPEDVRAAIRDAARPIRETAPSVRWTAADKLHLTVRFLGEVDPSQVDGLAHAGASVARRHGPVELAIGGIGAFPNPRRPRVVWMGVERSPRLELIAHELEEAIAPLGFEPEGRAFRPHVTLARVREEDQRAVAHALSDVPPVEIPDPVMAETIELMRSVPGAGGSRYEIQQSWRLAREVGDGMR